MEQLIEEISTYATSVGRKPQAVLRDAVGAKWGTWDAWCRRDSSPTFALVDRLRAYMAANPPVSPSQQDVA